MSTNLTRRGLMGAVAGLAAALGLRRSVAAEPEELTFKGVPVTRERLDVDPPMPRALPPYGVAAWLCSVIRELEASWGASPRDVLVVDRVLDQIAKELREAVYPAPAVLGAGLPAYCTAVWLYGARVQAIPKAAFDPYHQEHTWREVPELDGCAALAGAPVFILRPPDARPYSVHQFADERPPHAGRTSRWKGRA